ncbi:AraC family transcriptional regulator [Amycolatopsis suaedae]|uniref:AraC family transcriptional regulator n=1 Tax=Amycolatopsis suaedae TaxID=2510978 RepID=A0A4Q7J3L3_9PSEU|nr:AraC family transcriptional regulator [Amycolatopsis suaedae]RZQ60574.1 AraC family transcriptional regulator [Amycolatopsis suaedae]
MTGSTVGVHVARLVHEQVLLAGIDRAEVDRLPGIAPSALSDELVRVPTGSVARMWELLAWAAPEAGTGLRIADEASLGALGIWDYLAVHSRTVGEVLRNALRHRTVVADPDTNVAYTVNDDESVTVRWRGAIEWTDAAALNHEFVLGRLLGSARHAAAAPLVPLRVSFTHRAPEHHRRLTGEWNAAELEFDAPDCSITLSAADAALATPGADLRLGELLRGSMAVIVASAPSTVLPWLDRFRGRLAETPAVSLDAMATAMAMSGRTLQRRLAEAGTSWREEADRVRYEHALRLLRHDELTVQSVATRVGFTDARALRKAFRRWGGTAPAAVRATLARVDRTVSRVDLGDGRRAS